MWSKLRVVNIGAKLQISMCIMWSKTIVLQDKQWWGPLFTWLLTQDLSLLFLSIPMSKNRDSLPFRYPPLFQT